MHIAVVIHQQYTLIPKNRLSQPIIPVTTPCSFVWRRRQTQEVWQDEEEDKEVVCKHNQRLVHVWWQCSEHFWWPSNGCILALLGLFLFWESIGMLCFHMSITSAMTVKFIILLYVYCVCWLLRVCVCVCLCVTRKVTSSDCCDWIVCSVLFARIAFFWGMSLSLLIKTL